MKKQNQSICNFFSCWAINYSNKEYSKIKATSKKIDIREGNNLKKQWWTISPELNPDVYETNSLGQKVTFITDKDSISVDIKKRYQI